MSEEEKKAVDLLKQTIDHNSSMYIDNLGDNHIRIILNLIEKQQKELDNLRSLLYQIRQETRYNTISFENNYYKPIKNVTKQEIYKSYNIIRSLVKGNYVLLDNKEAIDSIVGEE